MNTMAATPLASTEQHGADPARPHQGVGEREPEDGQDDHPHRGAEVAAVDGGEEQAGPQRERVPPRRRAPRRASG